MAHKANLYKYADVWDQLNTESVSIVFYCKSTKNGTIRRLPVDKLQEPMILSLWPRFTRKHFKAIEESSKMLLVTPRLHKRNIMHFHKFYVKGNNLTLLIKANKSNPSARLMLYIGNDTRPWPTDFVMKMEFSANRSDAYWKLFSST